MTRAAPQLSIDTLPVEWREPLTKALHAKGFASATAYAESQPRKSLNELADGLEPAIVSPTRLERMLVDEAEQAGTMDRCARSLLARELRVELPGGWPPRYGDDTLSSLQRSGVFLTLAMALPDIYGLAVERIERAMATADIRAGWVPIDADDPVLLAVFDGYWDSTPRNAQPL